MSEYVIDESHEHTAEELAEWARKFLDVEIAPWQAEVAARALNGEHFYLSRPRLAGRATTKRVVDAYRKAHP